LDLNKLFEKLREKKFVHVRGTNNNNVISLYFSTDLIGKGNAVEVTQWEHCITVQKGIGPIYSDEIKMTEEELYKYIEEI